MSERGKNILDLQDAMGFDGGGGVRAVVAGELNHFGSSNFGMEEVGDWGRTVGLRVTFPTRTCFSPRITCRAYRGGNLCGSIADTVRNGKKKKTPKPTI
jgi:hypothetical protein